jgi:hypothetical protein
MSEALSAFELLVEKRQILIKWFLTMFLSKRQKCDLNENEDGYYILFCQVFIILIYDK